MVAMRLPEGVDDLHVQIFTITYIVFIDDVSEAATQPPLTGEPTDCHLCQDVACVLGALPKCERSLGFSACSYSCEDWSANT